MTLEQKKIKWWEWITLLSLDAPIVAVTWYAFVVKTLKLTHLSMVFPVLLFLAVWWIYSLDRLIDVKKRPKKRHQRRHLFYAQKSTSFSIILGVVSVFLGVGVFALPRAMVSSSVPLVVMVVGYGLLALLQKKMKYRSSVLKNVIASLAFGGGVFLVPTFYSLDSIYIALVLMLAGLCFINMQLIDVWETEEQGRGVYVSLFGIALAVSWLFSYLWLEWQAETLLFASYFWVVASSLFLMLGLHFSRRLFSLEILRFMIDVSLWLPVMIFLWI